MTDKAVGRAPGKEIKAPQEIAEAYLALDLAVGASWEEIEASRRAIVAQANPVAIRSLPPEEAEALRLAAHHANRSAALLRRR